MAGADLLRRVICTCGYCLERWNSSRTKSPVTAHRIIKEEKDNELGVKKATIQCTMCGKISEHYPRFSGKTRSQIKKWKEKHEASKLARKEAKKLARKKELSGGRD